MKIPGRGAMTIEHVGSSPILLKIFFVACSLVALSCSPARHSSSPRTEEAHRKALIFLEHQWLAAQDAATLERILASDFVHPVPSGDFLTKAQHIDWVTKHPRPANLRFDFDRLDVRIYGNTGIANGSVVTKDSDGKEIARNVFTDVFVYHDGRWQAVNGQETDVRDAR